MNKNSNGRWPPMEDDLKILKVEYIGNCWLDLSQILNLSWGDQSKYWMKLWRPSVEDDLKIKSGLSQQPLIGSSSNFKLMFGGLNQNWKLLIMKMNFNGSWPLY